MAVRQAARVFELDPKEREWLYGQVWIYHRGPKGSRPFRWMWNKEGKELDPGCAAPVSRAEASMLVGDPRKRNDATQWHRIVEALRSQPWYEEFLASGFIQVPDFYTDDKGYYSVAHHEAAWKKVGKAVPEDMFKLPSLPTAPVITEVSDEDFAEAIRNRPSSRPEDLVGHSFGPETSEDDDIAAAQSVASVDRSGVRPVRQKR